LTSGSLQDKQAQQQVGTHGFCCGSSLCDVSTTSCRRKPSSCKYTKSRGGITAIPASTAAPPWPSLAGEDELLIATAVTALIVCWFVLCRFCKTMLKAFSAHLGSCICAGDIFEAPATSQHCCAAAACKADRLQQVGLATAIWTYYAY
jgi:hypothetical protein